MSNIRVVGAVAAPPALKRLSEGYPGALPFVAPRCAVPDRPSRVPCCRAGLRVYVSMIDEKLDEQGRIFPGLGDAGDRAYGTA